MKLPFLRLFDNPLSKYLTFKIISCMQWLFWVICQNYKEVWGYLLLHIFCMIFLQKCFLSDTPSKSFNVIPFFLLKISKKMCYWVLIKTIDDVINYKICLRSFSKPMAGRQKRGKARNTKIWISWEGKELFRWNKKHFS